MRGGGAGDAPWTREADAEALADVARLAGAPGTRRERVARTMRTWQERIVSALEAEDGGTFRPYAWDRPGGGGGRARVIEGGAAFERGGVNMSAVHGAEVPPSLAAQHPGTEGRPFFATGLSMVLHPTNPHVCAFHANYRYFEVGRGEDSGVWWFGGGADATPSHPREADVVQFHQALKAQCDRHPQADHAVMKRTCDDYFTIRHRGEMRGVGGIFFDELSPPGAGDFAADLAFVEDGLATVLEAYLPLVRRRASAPWGAREKDWQRLRRGRYVEFNLVYDRGTLFGLQTRGNVEAILMSMPPEASWRFDARPAAGTEEARALRFYQPRDWAALTPEAARDEIERELAASERPRTPEGA
ncbi:MAG: oxygen-dependent coproporphyrinogen oxidase [Trueperaceae bacterium]|nr:oxygen-dependent coproporphyrinogen oxidase [Trueperaceae bacterium]